MHKRLPISPADLTEFCRRHQIRWLALYGSTAKDLNHSESDIDLLVEFESGFEPGLLALAGMELELSDQIGGVKVDLRTAPELSRYFRSSAR
jgi:uncharacterized protein